MPHAVWDTGLVAATQDLLPRNLIPGVEPGGGNVGGPKPAMLIKDLEIEITSYNPSDAEGQKTISVFLKLSQEADLTPGLILPIGVIALDVEQVDATGTVGFAPAIQQFRYPLGTVWAPRFVGLRVVVVGGITGFNASVHLDYEQVLLEWMDWFVMWDFLDNVTDNERQF